MLQRKLAPGAPGTKKYVNKYGDRLVCVRYKYDQHTGTKTKTIELIVTQEKWVKKKSAIPPNKKMYLNIHHTDTFLQKLVRDAGGTWDYKTRCLRLSFRMICSLGLEEYIDWSMEL
jgi:hypothetical protein